MRKKLITIFLAALALPVFAAEPQPVVQGNARFTVLTPRLVRMEWSADGKFEDRPTLGIINRNIDAPAFKLSQGKGRVVIKTDALTLTYNGGDKFNAKNLTVTFKDASAPKGVRTWKAGDSDKGNLMGTARTLDRFDAERQWREGDADTTWTRNPYDKGILSRDGWAIIDESNRQVFVKVDDPWEYWVENRPEGDRLDWYLFAYGHDYKTALADFTKVAGKIPLPPKYAFGYWWCRYWEYSDAEFADLAQHFRDYSIPIDVMVIDMDWHETWTERKIKWNGTDPSGNRVGWTGYTWKKELFPNPANFLTELHNYGVKTALNLHFQSGIQTYEEPYDRFVKDYLGRTSDYDGPVNYINPDGSKAYVPYRMSQMSWASSYFDTVMHPFEKQGVDFWWLDWQQWLTSKYVKDLNNTFWLNYCFWNDKARRNPTADRPMIYHRWGGIGSHRYQIGFSGDTYSTWKVLGALPYFTFTAANVGYGYWGHDIGGHQQPKGVNYTNPELYTRWLQNGVFTPIFKTHSTKDTSMEKRFWEFPETFDAMREAVRLRYDLSPYIYTACREAYDTGISICRPLYYELPEAPEAYSEKQEYFFGDDILATVVCTEADKVTGLAEREVWFPTGTDWYDAATGRMYAGGTRETLQYTVNENPWYVRAGAVIPMAGKDIENLQKSSNELRVFVVPGAGSFSTSLYEDDGISRGYDKAFARTAISKEAAGSELSVCVGAREGSYTGMPSTRKITVVLDSYLPPVQVKCGSTELRYARFPKCGQACWTYSGRDLQVLIYLPETSASEAVEVSCKWDGSLKDGWKLAAGKKGLNGRFKWLAPECKLAFETNGLHDIQLGSAFWSLAQCGSYLTEDPSNAAVILGAVDVPAMNAELQAIGKLPEAFRTRCAAQANL